MQKFWKSLRSWTTGFFASKGKTVPVEDLKVPAGETGWGSRSPRTTAAEDDLMVPVSELGWGSRAPKTHR